MSADRKPRGSDMLAQRWTKQDLAKLVDVEHDGVNLVEFFPKGIPDPDGGWGTWHVKPDALLKFLGTLLKHDKIPGVWVFPRGLPPQIDGFDVGFQAGSARER